MSSLCPRRRLDDARDTFSLPGTQGCEDDAGARKGRQSLVPRTADPRVFESDRSCPELLRWNEVVGFILDPPVIRKILDPLRDLAHALRARPRPPRHSDAPRCGSRSIHLALAPRSRLATPRPTVEESRRDSKAHSRDRVQSIAFAPHVPSGPSAGRERGSRYRLLRTQLHRFRRVS